MIAKMCEIPECKSEEVKECGSDFRTVRSVCMNKRPGCFIEVDSKDGRSSISIESDNIFSYLEAS
jgi:hypothetical protein